MSSPRGPHHPVNPLNVLIIGVGRGCTRDESGKEPAIACGKLPRWM